MHPKKRNLNIFASVIGLGLTASAVGISAASMNSLETAPSVQAVGITDVSTSGDTSSSAGSSNSSASKTAVASSGTQASSAKSSTGSTPTTSNTKVAVNSSGYADGTYSAGAAYRVPGTIESIKVSVTLANGIITNASVSQSGIEPESARYQEGFASAYRSYVIGKSIGSVNVSRISGASLTTEGFSNALAQIASKAAA